MKKYTALAFILPFIFNTVAISSPFDENSSKITNEVVSSDDTTGEKGSNGNSIIKVKASSIESYDFKLKPLVSPDKVKTQKILSKKIGSTWDTKNYDYTNVQGFCTDGTYWYVALMTASNDDEYSDQDTKLLKIRISDKEIVKAKSVGKIGHSNSLTYNPKTKKILTATCTGTKCYFCEFNASDLNGFRKVYLKNEKGETYKDKCFASFCYDPVKDQYIVKFNNHTLAFFNSDFQLINTVEVANLKINDDMTGQAISCDGQNIFSVCNNLNFPVVNYILCYDMKGNYIQKYTFKNQFGILWNNAEMEQIACYNGKYWSLCNNGTNKFRIHEIKLRE